MKSDSAVETHIDVPTRCRPGNGEGTETNSFKVLFRHLVRRRFACGMAVLIRSAQRSPLASAIVNNARMKAPSGLGKLSRKNSQSSRIGFVMKNIGRSVASGE